MSKQFRVLFYRPDYDHRWLDNLIGWYSFLVNMLGCIFTLRWSEIRILKKLLSSHVEIWTPDKNGYFEGYYTNSEGEELYGPVGICWTSTMGQTGTIQENGCVRRLASEVLTTPRRWYFYQFEVCDEAYDYMVKWMEHQVANNICYDKAELAKFFLPYRTQDPDDHKKICSGFSWVAMYKAFTRNNVETFIGGQHYHQLRFIQSITITLCRKFSINDLFSPLLMSYHLFKAGAKPIDLATGKEIK